jgi:Na+/melibiose symporter-like transporter
MLFWLLIVPTIAVAFSDVVVDALMVEVGQPLGLTGRLQSNQWACMYSATIVVGSLGGWLSQYRRQDWAFLICAIAIGFSFMLALFVVREPPRVEPHSKRDFGQLALILSTRSTGLLIAAAFLFLWNFNPFSATVQYVYITVELGLSEQFYGIMESLIAGACVDASVCYGFYCRRVPFGWLVHLSIVAGVLTTIAYWGLSGPRTAVIVAGLSGFAYMTGTLVQLDLAARVCPPDIAGTMFAVLMSLSNLGLILAGAVGGRLSDRMAAAYGAHTAFDILVAIGAVTTSLCWLLVPALRRSTT